MTIRINYPPKPRKANFWEVTFSLIVFTAFALLFFNLGRAYEILGTHTKEPPSVAFQPQKSGHSVDFKLHAYPAKWADVIPPISFNSFKMPVKKVKYLPPVTKKYFQ